MKNNNFNIVISGVGGQGVITLAQIIAEAAFVESLEVRTSELHGLSQRGGSVETHIRFGKKIFSPLVDEGRADLILGLEIAEALRKLYYANSKTVFLINDNSISYLGGLPEKELKEKLEESVRGKKYLFPASKICKEKLSSEVLSGVYLLGEAVFKKLIPLKPESVLKAIENLMPQKYLEINKKALNLAEKID